MRTILIGIIIFAIILFFWFLREPIGGKKKRQEKKKAQKDKGTEKIDQCVEILGLNQGASKGQLEQAYRDLASVWHPDRFTNNPRLQQKAERKLKEINAAYEYIRSFYRWK